jgi:predicted site-specific integrase-resolvase
MAEDDKWMDVEQVMRELHIARSTVDKYAREGKLKRFIRGKRTLFPRSMVEKLKEPKPKQS